MTALDDHKLTTVYFPRWTAELAKAGSVQIPLDFAPQFAHHLLQLHHELWRNTEQETAVDDTWTTRFYLRNRPTPEPPR